jgi:hypothetical protein
MKQSLTLWFSVSPFGPLVTVMGRQRTSTCQEEELIGD